MPTFIKRLTSQGLQRVDYTADSLEDAAQHEPYDGVYTLANTFNTYQVLKLDAHLDRLEDSARRANIALQLDRPALRRALHQMIEDSNYGDVRFRITVPRETPDHLILSIEPFKQLAPEIYANGIRCITLPDSARNNPAAKTTGWMHDRKQFTLPDGIFTGLLLDENGAILEGMSSNFYAILNRELRTAGEGVLAGIAQQVIFTVAPSILPVRKEAIHVSDIPNLSEAFTSGSSRGIIPVVEIDGVVLGNGKPGAQTRALIQAYKRWVQDHLEDL